MIDPVKILIVDDEPEARELLKFMLSGEKGVRLAGMAGDVEHAMGLLAKEKPDLILLDVQMPGKDGFKFIEMIHQKGYDPGIIFVTAYEHYAIQAIRTSVFDYILKPVRKEELLKAIHRYENRVKKENRSDLDLLLKALRKKGPDKIKINTRSGYTLLNPQDVVCCQADGNYTRIQMACGTMEVTTQNLGSVEALLKENSFFRISRSYLVNLNYLSRVDRKNSSCILEYEGGSNTIRVPSQKIKILESNFT